MSHAVLATQAVRRPPAVALVVTVELPPGTVPLGAAGAGSLAGGVPLSAGSTGAPGAEPAGSGMASAQSAAQATPLIRVMRLAPPSTNQRLPDGSIIGESVRLLRAVGRKPNFALMLPSAAMVAVAIWSPYSSAMKAVPSGAMARSAGASARPNSLSGPGRVSEALGRVRDRLGGIEVADSLARLARVPDAALAIERDAVRQRRRRDGAAAAGCPRRRCGGCAPGVGSRTGFGML